MNRDDVIRMARVAGLTEGCYAPVTNEELECFAALVAASEREACALVAQWTPDAMGVSQKIAASIRARSAV